MPSSRHVRLVVHVPAKDDGAEAEAGLGDGEELFLGDDLAAEDAVDVEAGELDAVVVLEQLGQVLRRERFGVWCRHGCGWQGRVGGAERSRGRGGRWERCSRH